ncbi:MAG: formate dehydrogenase accessory protein FdhE [Pseudomonadota bacterium]|nr:formate dehydrogenase accessory protein FdhE [Pseudomonadota bacterium]
MTRSSARPLLSPEEIAVRAGEQTPFIRYPERALVFGEREMRLRQLSPGHAMGDYLGFVAEIARVQGELLAEPIEALLPSFGEVEAASRGGLPLLPAAGSARDASWLRLQRRLLQRLGQRLPDSPARATIGALAAADDAALEAQADRLLSGVMLGLDLATAPLVAAALQVWFTHRVLATRDLHATAREPAFGRVDDETRCPCCGSLPVLGMLRIGGAEGGFRYLSCALCSVQWHMVRIKCSHCLSTKGIGYRSLRGLAADEDGQASATNADDSVAERAEAGRRVEGAATVARAVEAECCSECGHYLKMLHMERDPHVDPVADDLATLTLDLLVSEEGFARHGVDLMLLFGDPDASPPNGGGG